MILIDGAHGFTVDWTGCRSAMTSIKMNFCSALVDVDRVQKEKDPLHICICDAAPRAHVDH